MRPSRGWSAGERQLLALGRAILRKPAVLILDEPTSHIDDDAAERVLETVRWGEALADTTVLVIAHRLADIATCELACGRYLGLLASRSESNKSAIAHTARAQLTWRWRR